MSHFSVLVVTDERPDHDALARILQPWHEFECTGTDDEFVQEIDKTEEAREIFETETTKRLRGPKGGLHMPYDDQFYRDPTDEEAKKIGPFAGTGWSNGLSYTSKDWGDGKGYRAKVRYVPDGYEEVELPLRDVESFADWVKSYYGFEATRDPAKRKGKYGYVHVDIDGRVIRAVDRTNPNARWDWWVLGGRYSGRLRPKKGREESAQTGKRSWTNEAETIVGVDSCQICDLDLEAMQAQRSGERRNWIDEIVTKSELSRGDVDRAIKAKAAFHAEWLTLAEPRPRGAEYTEWMKAKGELGEVCAKASAAVWELPDVGALTVEEWIHAAPAITSFAVVKDGQWYEEGKMGWWAVVHDEKPDWDQKFIELFASLRPDQYVSVVDCHI